MGSWQIEHMERDNILHVKVTGEMTEDQVVRHVSDALAVAAAHGCTRFLVDHREMIPLVPIARLYGLPGVFEGVGLRRTHRLGVLYSPSTGHGEEYKFFETVSVNNGFQVQLFTRDSEAMAWLKVS